MKCSAARSILIQESERSFEAHLSQIDDQADDESSESLWTAYSTILSETANKILGEMKRNPKKPWISNEVLKLTEDKSKLRKNRNTPAQDQRYKDLRSEIQRKLKGVLHPRPVFGLFLHFSQKLQHIGNK